MVIYAIGRNVNIRHLRSACRGTEGVARDRKPQLVVQEIGPLSLVHRKLTLPCGFCRENAGEHPKRYEKGFNGVVL
jgi:hypothetical protein